MKEIDKNAIRYNLQKDITKTLSTIDIKLHIPILVEIHFKLMNNINNIKENLHERNKHFL